MKLLIKQRVFSWGDKYDIYDEQGNVKYFVKGEIFSFGHQLHVYDMYDNEIGSVHEKIFSFPKKFEIVMNGATRGIITKQFTFFFQKYDVDFNGWLGVIPIPSILRIQKTNLWDSCWWWLLMRLIATMEMVA